MAPNCWFLGFAGHGYEVLQGVVGVARLGRSAERMEAGVVAIGVDGSSVLPDSRSAVTAAKELANPTELASSLLMDERRPGI